MRLGGGLEKALIDEEPPKASEISEVEPEKPATEKPEAKKKAEKPDAKKEVKSVSVSHPRERPRAAARPAPRRPAASVTPIALIARTLDHTGTNIGLLRVQTPGP